MFPVLAITVACAVCALLIRHAFRSGAHALTTILWVTAVMIFLLFPGRAYSFVVPYALLLVVWNFAVWTAFAIRRFNTAHQEQQDI